MKVERKFSRVLAVVAILLVVYNVLAFALPFVKTGAFWLGWLFGLVALLAQPLILRRAFRDGAQVKSLVYGFPIARLGALYLIAQLVLSFAAMALAKVLPMWVAAVLCVLVLAAAAVGMIGAGAAREAIETQEAAQRRDTSAMRKLQAQAEALCGSCGAGAAGQALRELADALRYSDPVSGPATGEAEAGLASRMEALKVAVSDGDGDAILDQCKRFRAALDERNRLCKQGKGAA